MLTIMDYALAPFYLLVVFIIAYWLRARHRDNPIYKYFIPGLFVKIFGGIAFGMVYAYYYGFGDTFEYFKGINGLYDIFFDDFSDFVEVFKSSGREIQSVNWEFHDRAKLSDGSEEFFMMKTLFFLNLLCFKKYLLLIILTNFICFFGIWRFYRVVVTIYKENTKLLAYVILFFPTIVFWGSGLMKDTLVYSCLLIVLSYVFELYYTKKFKISNLLLLVVFFYIGYRMKSYIMLVSAVVVLLMIYFAIYKNIRNRFLSYALTPVMAGIFIIIGYFGLINLAESSKKYSLKSLEFKSKGFQSWHTTLGGSSYSLGEIEYSATGIISKVPAALNVTFFRPYIWEVSNPLMVLTALESLLITVAVFYLFIKFKFRVFNLVLKDKIILVLLIYSLILGFAVGFTSYNFGALARYKIPCLATFLTALVLIYSQLNTQSTSE